MKRTISKEAPLIASNEDHANSPGGRRRSAPRAAGARAVATTGLLLALGLGGCAWVDVEEEARTVAVRRTKTEVVGCTERGRVSAQTRSKVGFIARNETTVAVELERLARNRAAKLGADVIVPTGPVTAEGSRSYSAWSCPD